MITFLPTLDCHAHVSAAVTDSQIRALGNTIVFAMARKPSEADDAANRRDLNIIWSCGAHPTYTASGGIFDIDRFVHRSSQLAVVGEIGLDRRSGNLSRQEEVLDSIIHWFTGQPKDVDRFFTLGCYFSVNSAMRQEILRAIPFDRVLPETDFPTTRNRTGKLPGDTLQVEHMLANIYGVEPAKVRHQVYRNLRRVSLDSGAIDRMTPYVADLLLAV